MKDWGTGKRIEETTRRDPHCSFCTLPWVGCSKEEREREKMQNLPKSELVRARPVDRSNRFPSLSQDHASGLVHRCCRDMKRRGKLLRYSHRVTVPWRRKVTHCYRRTRAARSAGSFHRSAVLRVGEVCAEMAVFVCFVPSRRRVILPFL